ncbi:MAG: glycosyltransferase [Deltaproteobacteria bacterium]|nr:glycosyltransferase [Deltaproteobacteria bacterium]
MEEITPKVSVIMSVYNEEKHLREAVESILNQTFKDFEFIIINDGSTDRTGDILESYADERIVIVNQDKTGLTKALNRGLSLARGKYIARMDADDISLPKRLEKQIQFLEENTGVELVSCHFYEIDSGGCQINLCQLPVKNEDIQKSLLVCNQFCHGAAVFKSECIRTIGTYREFFRFSQDFDLWLRIAEKFKCANLNTPLYKWRINPQSQFSASIKDREDQCLYAAFAIILSKERRKSGQDRLEKFPDKQWNLKREINFKARIVILSKIYLLTSKALQKRRGIASARILAKQACYCNPFQWENWRNLLALMRCV